MEEADLMRVTSSDIHYLQQKPFQLGRLLLFLLLMLVAEDKIPVILRCGRGEVAVWSRCGRGYAPDGEVHCTVVDSLRLNDLLRYMVDQKLNG